MGGNACKHRRNRLRVGTKYENRNKPSRHLQLPTVEKQTPIVGARKKTNTKKKKRGRGKKKSGIKK